MIHTQILAIDKSTQKNVQMNVKLNYCDKNVKSTGFDDYLVDTSNSTSLGVYSTTRVLYELCLKLTQSVDFEFEMTAGSPIFCGDLGFIGRVSYRQQ